MSIPELLTEAEIRDIYENGRPAEAIAIYGWDRIVTTLAGFNVLRKRLEELKAKTEQVTKTNLTEH